MIAGNLKKTAYTLICAILVAAPGWTQGLNGYQDPMRYSELRFSDYLSVAPESGAAKSTDRGTPSSDIIRGNGAKAGYTLSRGGIILGSETVTVDGSLLRRNTDYYLDSASGMLLFTQPVRVTQTIRVSYRYSPEKDKQKSAISAPTMALNFGPGSSMGITLAQSAYNNSYDLLTYGLNLKTKLGQNASMSNMMYISSGQESGRLAFDQNGVKQAATPAPKTDNLFVHNSDMKSGKLTMKMSYQDVGKDFSGFSTLKQQKVAADDILAQLEKEKGIQRLGFQSSYALNAASAAGMNWGRITDASGSVMTQSLSFGGSKAKLSAEVREISSGFVSFGKLTAAEQQAMGKESGMRRMNLAGDFNLGVGTQLKTSFSQVQAGDAGVEKYGLAYSSKKLSVAANYQDIDPQFTRVMDLADSDKKTMATEQGMKRYDISTHLLASKSVTVDSLLYNAKHSTTGAFRRQLRNSLVLSPTRGPKLTLLDDRISVGSPAASTDTEHQQITLSHKMGVIAFNGMHDTIATSTSAGNDSILTTDTLHLDNGTGKKLTMVGDWNSVSNTADGKFNDTKSLKLAYKLTKALDFSANGLSVSTEQCRVMTQDYSLVGKVCKNIGLKSRFAETAVDGTTSSITRELSMVSDTPRSFGLMERVKWNFAFSEVECSNGTITQSKSAHVEAGVLDQNVAVDYAGGITKDGQKPITRTYTISGDPDPKSPFHYSVAYKMVDPGAAEPMLIRKYDADWQISSATKLIYSYFSYVQRPDGKLDLLGGEKLKLTTPFSKDLSFLCLWENTEDYSKDWDKQSLSLGLTGKTADQAAFEASVGIDRVDTAGKVTTSHTYRLKYDCQVDADHFLTFSGKYTDWTGEHKSNPNDDDVFLQLDFRTVFS